MACPGLGILLLLLGIIWGKQYVTVFYGVPNWDDNVSVPLICASANTSLWVTTSCLPDLQSYAEVPIYNISENFTIPVKDNQVIQQAWSAMNAMVDSIMKPCVKINPYCVRMQCGEVTKTPTTTPKTTTQMPCFINEQVTVKNPGNETRLEEDLNCTRGLNETTERNAECQYNVTGLCRDCRTEIKQSFRYDDVTCSGERENRTCYMTHCNDSIITQDCNKGVMQNAYFRLCAPAGYMLLRCNEQLNFSKKCENITATPCTGYMLSSVSSFFGFNGTNHTRDELIPLTPNKMEDLNGAKFVYKVAGKWGLIIRCIRKGNRSEVSTISSTGYLFYYGLEHGSRLRLAQCKFEGQWGRMFNNLGKMLKELNAEAMNYTEGTGTCDSKKTTCGRKLKGLPIANMTRHGADLATEMLMHTCGEEMFFCNVTRIFQEWNNKNSDKWYPWANCHIKSIIDDWATIGKKIYLPPTSGFNNRIRCTHRVTEMFFEMEKWEPHEDLGGNLSIKFLPPSWETNQFVAEGSKYKLIKLNPIGFAPTDEHRYAPRGRQTRAAPLALGALGLLSAAGTAMGLVSTILTVQAQAVLQGILQQQKQLLVLVEKQQELLRLTIWGVKNLQARLTALEEYVKHQALLASWGCQWKQVCHTNVEWTYNITPNWTKDTWREWESKVAIYDKNITSLLQEAYTTELENQNKFKKLQEFNFWSWLDISHWFTYVKYAVLIILVIIGLRVLSFIIQNVVKMCRGYRVLSPSVYIEQDYKWEKEENQEQPDREEEKGADTETIYINLEQCKKESSRPLWNVDWNEPLQDSLLVTLLKWLKEGGILLLSLVWQSLSWLWHLLILFFQNGQRLWQTSSRWMVENAQKIQSWLREKCRRNRGQLSSTDRKNIQLGKKKRWRLRFGGRSGISSEATETAL
ncbi:envelope protein [Simian immunodeficiency virus]|uniref:Envelope protein n=1 Tax=Simian immunodeficiency virus TaxID=11723 RepID=O90278_SIV|nr:envelope protein [Simian immunodeficiency virus]UYP40510.1 envelope glycoprotein [synthetic construct]